MTLRFVFAAALAASFGQATPAQAQPTDAATPVTTLTSEPSGVDAARDIQRNGLSVGLYQGFFSPIGVYREGTLIDIGIFGGDAGRYFDSNPNVVGHLQSFRKQKIAGVALWSAGMGALVADIALVCATASNREVQRDNQTLVWSLLGSGIVTSIVGAIVMNTANHSLENAVQAHNADLLNKYLPPEEHTASAL